MSTIILPRPSAQGNVEFHIIGRHGLRLGSTRDGPISLEDVGINLDGPKDTTANSLDVGLKRHLVGGNALIVLGRDTTDGEVLIGEV